ncbi:transposase family protein [Streptomyces scopuliridis]|uniref:transposase family protein n=1 Tax=Streptomyces scopuliridis TaxID=452529 RepID=UPI003673DA14
MARTGTGRAAGPRLSWPSPTTHSARNKPLTPAKKQVNELIASVRAVCEHAFAHLRNWRVITNLRLQVRHATALLRALLVLTSIDVAR